MNVCCHGQMTSSVSSGDARREAFRFRASFIFSVAANVGPIDTRGVCLFGLENYLCTSGNKGAGASSYRAY